MFLEQSKVFLFSSPSRWDLLIYRHIRIIHVIKISLALLIAHLIALIFAMPNLAWTSVTIVIIMLTLPQVGGTLEKSLQRVIGTLCGAAYGILILFVSHEPLWQGTLALFGIAFVTWRASGRMSYAYLVAGFTMMIVLDGGASGIEAAIWRTITILLGCCIAIGVSQLVLPLRARNEWRWLLADTLSGMAHLWQGQLSPNVHKLQKAHVKVQGLRRKVLRQRGMINSVCMESRHLRASAPHLTAMVEAQDRCLLLLELLAQTRWETQESDEAIRAHYAMSLRARELGELLSSWAIVCSGHSASLPASTSAEPAELKHFLSMHLHQHPSESLNPYGYSWLIYQTSLQLQEIDKLLRHLACAPDSSGPHLN